MKYHKVLEQTTAKEKTLTQKYILYDSIYRVQKQAKLNFGILRCWQCWISWSGSYVYFELIQ